MSRRCECRFVAPNAGRHAGHAASTSARPRSTRRSRVRPLSTRKADNGSNSSEPRLVSRWATANVKQRAQRESQGAAADVAEENAGLREIEGQEAETGRGQRQRQASRQVPPVHDAPAPTATRAAWVPAMPLMPSMKFQMLVSAITGNERNERERQVAPGACDAPARRPRQRTPCTPSRSQGDSGRWSSTRPTPATSTSPTTKPPVRTTCVRIAPAEHAGRDQQRDDDRNAAAAWRRHGVAATLAGLVDQLALDRVTPRQPGARTSPIADMQNEPERMPSDHRVVEQRLDRCPTPCSSGTASGGCARRSRNACSGSSDCAPATGR